MVYALCCNVLVVLTCSVLYDASQATKAVIVFVLLRPDKNKNEL
jgi:hypothetical protein